MSLEEKITEDLKTAMRAKDEVALRGIRAIKSAILLAKTDGSHQAIDEAREVQMLQKLVKTRQESLDIYTKNNREELAQKEREVEGSKQYHRHKRDEPFQNLSGLVLPPWAHRQEN